MLGRLLDTEDMALSFTELTVQSGSSFWRFLSIPSLKQTPAWLPRLVLPSGRWYDGEKSSWALAAARGRFQLKLCILNQFHIILLTKYIYFKMYRMPALCLVSCKVFMILRWTKVYILKCIECLLCAWYHARFSWFGGEQRTEDYPLRACV